jgi:hypothetical protein
VRNLFLREALFRASELELFHGYMEVLRRLACVYASRTPLSKSATSPRSSACSIQDLYGVSNDFNIDKTLAIRVRGKELRMEVSLTPKDDLLRYIIVPKDENEPGFDLLMVDERAEKGHLVTAVQTKFSRPTANTSVSPNDVIRAYNLTMSNLFKRKTGEDCVTRCLIGYCTN